MPRVLEVSYIFPKAGPQLLTVQLLLTDLWHVPTSPTPTLTIALSATPPPTLALALAPTLARALAPILTQPLTLARDVSTSLLIPLILSVAWYAMPHRPRTPG
jgi:hypothetical protein